MDNEVEIIESPEQDLTPVFLAVPIYFIFIGIMMFVLLKGL